MNRASRGSVWPACRRPVRAGRRQYGSTLREGEGVTEFQSRPLGGAVVLTTTTPDALLPCGPGMQDHPFEGTASSNARHRPVGGGADGRIWGPPRVIDPTEPGLTMVVLGGRRSASAGRRAHHDGTVRLQPRVPGEFLGFPRAGPGSMPSLPIVEAAVDAAGYTEIARQTITAG